MSKKKQPKNGFFLFMLDMQQKYREGGRNVKMGDMPVFAGPAWSKLSDAEKQGYNQKAREEREKGKGIPCGTSSLTLGGGSHVASSAAAARPGVRDCSGNLLSVS